MKGVWTAIIAAVLLVSCAGGKDTASGGTVDGISKASTHFYYEKGSLAGEALFDSINSREGAVTIATVNEDGSPNMAVAVPGVIGDKYLMFGFSPNQTAENIRERKLAVIAYYIYTPDAQEKNDRNRGARLICEYVDDPVKINEIKDILGSQFSESSTFLEIVKILPLG